MYSRKNVQIVSVAEDAVCDANHIFTSECIWSSQLNEWNNPSSGITAYGRWSEVVNMIVEMSILVEFHIQICLNLQD